MASKPNMTQTVMECISSYLTFNDKGCWLFRGGINSQGYGQIFYQDKFQLVHRVVYRLMKGKIPVGIFVLHSCDTPRCCNPDHLFLGAQQDNIDDMIAKGRNQGWYKPLVPLAPSGTLRRRI